MPIAKDRSQQIVPQDLPVNVESPEYRGITVDTYKTPINSLMAFVEGSSWITEYYSQVVNNDSELNPLQPNLPTPYQQYTQIKDLEIKVDNPISHVQNSETNEFEVRGGGKLYGGVIPNVGDMFLADVGDGREGVFTITLSEKKSMFRNAVYQIEFLLTGYNGAEKRFELIDKVVKTVYFRRDFILYGQKPVIVQEEVLTLDKLTFHLENIKQFYFSRFYSNEYSTLIVPNQKDAVYDPFVLNCILSIMETSEHPALQKLRAWNVEGAFYLKQDTIWSALTNVDKRYLDNAVKHVWSISTEYWDQYPVMKTIRFSGISGVMYPVQSLSTVDKQYNDLPDVLGTYLTDLSRLDNNGVLIPWVDPAPTPEPYVIGDWDASHNQFPIGPGSGLNGEIETNDAWLVTVAGVADNTPIIVDTFIKALVNNPGQISANWGVHNTNDPVIPAIPLIRPVTLDNYYVLSQAFYDETLTGQSVLEVQVNNLLNNRNLDLNAIYQLCQDYKNWGLLEQFYYLPMLIILLKVAPRLI